MSVIPKNVVDRIEFTEQHIAPFTANAVAIGSSAATITALDTKCQAARAAYEAQKAAQNAAKAATNELKIKLEAMTVALASVISQIKTQAGITGPGVYSLAEIPAPATPGPIGPLGKPSDFVVTLDESGALHLKWKCTNPPAASGTFYQIWRRIGPAGEFAYLGGTGDKKLVDATVPAGASALTYQLQAVRSTAVGPWAQFNVNFGTGAGGAGIASVVETKVEPKIAA
jgi:hypothetical protein